jgi:hypothetical protein
MTVVLDDGDDILVKPISPAFVNQTEPVLNREDGMYVDLCICVWHHDSPYMKALRAFEVGGLFDPPVAA